MTSDDQNSASPAMMGDDDMTLLVALVGDCPTIRSDGGFWCGPSSTCGEHPEPRFESVFGFSQFVSKLAEDR